MEIPCPTLVLNVDGPLPPHERCLGYVIKANKQTPWPLVRKRTILTDRLPLVGEI
jgi:hypothetical protein